MTLGAMDDQTEELRDIFLSATDEEIVTESQEASRGSLPEDEQRTNERIEEVIARMRDRYEFRTSLSDATLREVVRGFYRGEDDVALAAALEVDAETAFKARLDLHLIHEADLDTPFDPAELRDLRDGCEDLETVAGRLDADEATIERCRHVLDAIEEARRSSHRFRSAFEDVLPDAVISVRHTSAVMEDGLDEATEGMETDVSL